MCPDESGAWQTNPIPCTALERVEQACAALQVLQQRVLDLEKWQAMQNGHLRSLDEGLTLLRETVAQKLDASRSERNHQLEGLSDDVAAARKEQNDRMDGLYRVLVTALISLALTGLGLIAAHVTGHI